MSETSSPLSNAVQLLRDAGCCEDDAARSLLARAILDAAREDASQKMERTIMEAKEMVRCNRNGSLNTNSDERLTKSGGLSFELWRYILELEMCAHGNPIGNDFDSNDFREFFDDDHTPHSAVEEDFAAGQP